MIHPAYKSFPSTDHDHSVCLTTALRRAKGRCAEKGVKWTSLRERVFTHLARSHRPLSAYDLIESVAGEGKRLSPVSVYRILDVLREIGLVHRLESKNSYFACLLDHPDHMSTVVNHCDDCERVAEKDAAETMSAISNTIEVEGFKPRQTIVEINGTCGDCASEPRGDRSC